jgi:hypothetical protein
MQVRAKCISSEIVCRSLMLSKSFTNLKISVGIFWEKKMLRLKLRTFNLICRHVIENRIYYMWQ